MNDPTLVNNLKLKLKVSIYICVLESGCQDAPLINKPNMVALSKMRVRLTDLLTALLSPAVHDDWRVDEGAGGGHVLSQQAFHFVGTQTDRQIEQLHRSSLGTTMTAMSESHFPHAIKAHFTPKIITAPSFQEKSWQSFRRVLCIAN